MVERSLDVKQDPVSLAEFCSQLIEEVDLFGSQLLPLYNEALVEMVSVSSSASGERKNVT